VREFEDESGRVVIIVLDRRTPSEAAAFESAVSWAASLALLFLRRGFRVGLEAGGTYIPPDSGSTHGGQILRCLALVDENTSGATPAGLPAGVWRGINLLTVIPAAGRPRIEMSTVDSTRRSA